MLRTVIRQSKLSVMLAVTHKSNFPFHKPFQLWLAVGSEIQGPASEDVESFHGNS